MPLGGFFWGGLESGLANGMNHATDLLIKKQQLDMQKKQMDLKAKMLQSQLDDHVRQVQANQDLANALSNSGMPEHANAPDTTYTQGGQFAAPPMAQDTASQSYMTGTPQMTPQQIAGGMVKAGLGAHLGSLLKPAGTATGQHPYVVSPGGQMYDPTGKLLAENKNQRSGVGPNSKIWAQIEAENPGADLETKLGIYNNAIQGQASARGLGSALGSSQGKEQSPVPLGKEKDMARLAPNGKVEMAPSNSTPQQLRTGGFRTVDPEVLAAGRALTPASDAFTNFSALADQLANESSGIGGSLSNAAGALPGLAGSLAQRMGASHTGDDLKAAGLIFMQHYDRVVGGLRGASSPQLLQVMEQRMPQPGMTPGQIQRRKAYLGRVFAGMKQDVQNAINGKPFEGAGDKAIMSDPDSEPQGRLVPVGR